MTVLAAGQVAVVTGAASGIGLELVKAFGRRGMGVALVDLDAAALAAAGELAGAEGVHTETFVADVGDSSAMVKLAADCVERFGRVDVVCLNAGVIQALSHVWTIAPERWRQVAQVNLWGVVNGIHAFVPYLVAQDFGHVVTTASMSGLSIVPGSADYMMTKHAAVAVSEVLRAELDVVAPGVGVTVVCPGPVRTAMTNFGVAPAPDDPRLADPDGIRESIGIPHDAMAEPAEVVDQAIRAIEQNRLYVSSSPAAVERASERIDRILRDLSHPDAARG